MSVEQQVDALATSVEILKSAVISKKATLDASVMDAQSATAQALAAKMSALSARDQAGAFKDAAYTAAQSAASAVAYQDLTALAVSKAVTAVDVFIYDTSKDSDGGAWRHRCAGTSWYREPLNTAIRGGRREFPAVAVIVAEASKIIVYDGDDPALPMWMVFQGGASGLMPQIAGGYPVTSVIARDGEVYAGHGTGLFRCNFISDRATNHEGSPYTSKRFTNNIAQRSAASFVEDASIPSLTHRSVNDVAIAVRPAAEIQPTTGLPMPTIAAGTSGGTSILKDDGTVVSDNTLSHNPNTATLTFGPDNVLWLVAAGNHFFKWHPPYDTSGASEIMPYSPGNILAQWYSWVATPVDFTAPSISERQIGHNKGLTRFEDSRHCFTAAAWITGWMPANTVLVACADTDDADLVGGQEIPLAAVDTNWTANGNGSFTSNGGSGNIKFNVPAGAMAGDFFRLRFTVNESISGIGVAWSTALGAPRVNTAGIYEIVAPWNGSYGQLWLNAQSWAGTISDISVQPADADRSVNAKGLVINGTVARAPVATGAELMAYGPFPAPSDYLLQPYNALCDFGAGDFSVIGWVEWTSGGPNIQIPLAKNELGKNLAPYFELQIIGGSLSWVSNAGGNQIGFGSLPSGLWQHIAYTRQAGIGSAYLNGQLVQSKADANNYNHAGADQLLIGRRGDDYPCASTRLSLLRISATAPTAAQIRLIYEEERALFQENAACTLYGASDAVTALAHDPDTGLLHVGTSAGRSVFQGLRRVANTTVPVGVAIAAAGGMVVDD